MPFTFAHPAAILPFHSKFFNTTALFIGAMAPDFLYFILFSPSNGYGHTLAGSFLLNLPLCFLVYFLLEYGLKQGFILGLPYPFRKYYSIHLSPQIKLNSCLDLFKFVTSSFLGMFTHILWDQFTHFNGYFVTTFPALQNPIFQGLAIPLYKLLQHSSTCIGLFILFIYFLQKTKLNITFQTFQSYVIHNFISNFKLNRIKKEPSSFIKFWLSFLLYQISFLFIVNGITRIYGSSISIGRLVITLCNGAFIYFFTLGRIFYFKSKRI